jgi:hypothetical protein
MRSAGWSRRTKMRSPLAHALAALVLVVALHAPASTFGQPNREFMLENGPRASRSSLFVLSFPSGREVHLLLENRLGQYFDESIALTAEENLAGTTPLRVELEAGLYRVAVGSTDQPFTCHEDGEDSFIAVLSEGALLPAQKVYSFNKTATHAGILVALFWPKNQTLGQFVGALPSEDLFDVPGPTVEHFKDDFEEHKVPREDWELLTAMFRKTGKLVWHGAERSDLLISQWVGLDEGGQPKWLTKQPVLELR